MLKIEEVSKAVAENLEGDLAGFDWLSIIELIMTLLGGNCFQSKSSLKQYKKDVISADAGPIKKIAALVVIKRETGLRRKEALKLRDELFATMDVLTDEELEQVYTEVVKETMPPRFVI